MNSTSDNAFVKLLDRVRDDTGYGMLMFYAFTAAVLIISGSIAALAFVTQWWMLAVVVAVHMAITGVVSSIVFHAFDVPSPADAEDAVLVAPAPQTAPAPSTASVSPLPAAA
ncbi:MAG TPA: hypothetical protein VKV21_13020 [Solirubrobacteraceae bacterium]|nr:hypothetical protein [Solirubrobacteraceae bacterium]